MNIIDTVTASELRANLSEKLTEIEGNAVLRVTHRGCSIKVVITQEYYLRLLEGAAGENGDHI